VTTTAASSTSGGVSISSLGLGLTGLSSGLDTDSIISQLLAVDKLAEKPINAQQAKVTAEQTALKDVASKLTALKTAAAALSHSGTAFATAQSVESSDATKVLAVKVSGAGTGGHTVQVDRLASSAQQGFAVGDLSAGGSFTITSAAGASTPFTISAGASPSSIVDQINGSTSSPVYAAMVTNANGDQRLVLSSRTTGEASRFSVSSSTLTADAAYDSPAGTLDAQYHLDGSATVLTSPTNQIDNAVAGLRLTLKGVTTSPVSVTVGAPDVNRDAITTKIQAVVDAYNAVVDDARTYITTKPQTTSSSDSTTTPDPTVGILFGDTGLTSMLSNLRSGLRQTLSGVSGITKLADLGIDVPPATGSTPSADATAGKFSLNADKLATALNGDWTKVSSFLDAFSTQVTTLVGAQTGKATSSLDARVAGDDKRLGKLTDQLSQVQLRLDSEQTRLKAQFAAMEAALSKAQSEQSWLTGQINSLQR
jgi:flagellar hook-associated protein 2